jgi:hypothetical protein
VIAATQIAPPKRITISKFPRDPHRRARIKRRGVVQLRPEFD